MNVTLKNRDVDRGLTLLGPFVKRGLPVKLSFAIVLLLLLHYYESSNSIHVTLALATSPSDAT